MILIPGKYHVIFLYGMKVSSLYPDFPINIFRGRIHGANYLTFWEKILFGEYLEHSLPEGILHGPNRVNEGTSHGFLYMSQFVKARLFLAHEKDEVGFDVKACFKKFLWMKKGDFKAEPGTKPPCRLLEYGLVVKLPLGRMGPFPKDP